MLTDLNGLSALTSVDELVIQSNPALTNVNGLSALTGTGQALNIINNPALTNLNGLSALTSVRFFMTLARNAALTDLNGLSALTSVGGKLVIFGNSNLTDLNGLDALTSVAAMTIESNPRLADLNGLDALTSMRGSLIISGNSNLTELNGLDALTSVDELAILNNQALTNVNGLSSLTSVGGNLSIVGNTLLTDLNGLAALTSVGGSLRIQSLPTLTDVNGLSALTSVGGNLFITANQALADCVITAVCDATVVIGATTINGNTGACVDLATAKADCTPDLICPTTSITLSTQQQVDDFTTIYNVANCTFDAGITITGTDIANLDGLATLTSVGGNLYINSNPTLTNVSGLSSLTSVGRELQFFANPSLTDLNGLSTLTTVRELFITNNATLTDLNGLAALTSVDGRLIIRNNATLADCAIAAVCDATVVTGATTITGNTGACLDLATAAADCPLVDAEAPMLVVTNPADDAMNVGVEQVLTAEFNEPVQFAIGGEIVIQDLTAGTPFGTINATSSAINFRGNGFTIDPMAPFKAGNAYEVQIDGTALGDAAGNPFVGIPSGGWTFTTAPALLCPTNLIDLSTQQQVDDFATTYDVVNCSFDGGILIRDSDITNIDGLATLTSIGGSLTIRSNNVLTDLNGLSSLTSVRGNLGIVGNTLLTDLNGLAALTSVGGILLIQSSPSLTDVNGLSALTSIGGSGTIRSNNVLTDLNGLSSLTRVGGNLGIVGNTLLTDLNGLAALTSVGGNLQIQSSPSLIDVNGLSALTRVEGNLFIRSNATLSNCAIAAVCDAMVVTGSSFISSNTGDCLDLVVAEAACPDTNPPTLVSLDPLNEATDNAIEATLTGTFSEPVQFASGGEIVIQNLTAGTSFGTINAASGAISFSGNGLTIDPMAPFKAGNAYEVQIDGTALEDAAGNPFVGIPNGGWTFTTAPALLCPTNEITLSTQQQVDDFATTYDVANCFFIPRISITGPDITNLEGLATLTSVAGDLFIEINPALTDLNGLSALTSVGGHLNIFGNAILTDLNGLSALTSVGNLGIGGNATLTDLNGLSALTRVGGNLNIGSNPTLTDITGLAALTSLRVLSITNNATLTNLNGLSALTRVGQKLDIEGNATLTDITGLAALTSVRALSITNNATLTNLNGLSALTSVDRGLEISRNDLLTDLNGLSALASVGGVLDIQFNPALTDVNGLSALTNVGLDLFIRANTTLANCAIAAVCDAMVVTGDSFISVNTGDCLDLGTAEAACADTTPPVITCPADVTVAFGASTDPMDTGEATATDDNEGVVISSEDITVGQVITRTWTATDATENSASCMQMITMEVAVVDLELSFVSENPTPTIGEEIFFTLTVSNEGPDTATGIVVENDLPSGYMLGGFSKTQGEYDFNNRIWSVGDLAVGQKADLILGLQIMPSGDYLISAEVTEQNEQDFDSTPNNGVGADEDDDASTSVTPMSAEPSVVHFELIDADNDVVLRALMDGDVIDVTTLPTTNLNIHALTTGDTESVRMVLSGTEDQTRTENVAPYALYGDTSGNYAAHTFALGSYSLQASPYSEDNLGGDLGSPLTVSFSFVTAPVDLDGDTYFSDVDCNDNDPAINPGAAEVCDGIDNNCDGLVDGEDPAVTCDNSTEGFADLIDATYLMGASNPSPQGPILRTEEGNRETYLKFDVSEFGGAIIAAELQMQVASDPGNGTLEVYLGSDSDWTENGLDGSNKPSTVGSPLATITGTHSLGQNKVWDLNVGQLTGGGIITLIVKHSNGNDVAFASDETNNPPTLLLRAGMVAPADIDGDGFFSDVDCDDNNPDVNPDALEICDGIDNNCDGLIDDEDPSVTCAITEVSADLIDATYLQGAGNPSPTGPILRAEEGNRVAYLKFDMGMLDGPVTQAQLEMTVASDPGSGTLEVFLGSDSNWTENGLNGSNKPTAVGSAVAVITGTHSLGQIKIWDLDLEQLPIGGLVTLIVKHSNGNDVAFASDETNQAPKLILSLEDLEVMLPNELNLSPNPASDEIVLEFDIPTQVGAVFVYDVSGKLVQTVPVGTAKSEGDYPMDVSGLPSGMYFVRTFDADGVPHQKAMVIEN